MPEKLEDIISMCTLVNNPKYGKTLKVLINNYWQKKKQLRHTHEIGLNELKYKSSQNFVWGINKYLCLNCVKSPKFGKNPLKCWWAVNPVRNT